jgi:hypothetical protein
MEKMKMYSKNLTQEQIEKLSCYLRSWYFNVESINKKIPYRER